MKKRTLRRKILAVILSVAMLVPMLTLPAEAFSYDEYSMPYSKIFYDEEVQGGYVYAACAQTVSGAHISTPYAQGYMLFEEADPNITTSRTVGYSLRFRVDYILDSLRQYDEISYSAVPLTPGMDSWWGDLEGSYIYFDYNLAKMDMCQYIFTSANTTDGYLRAIKAYKDEDFSVYGY